MKGENSQLITQKCREVGVIRAIFKFRRALLVLAFAFLTSAVSWAELTEKQILDQVTESTGPILEPDRLPVLFDSIKETFERLTQAQEQLIGSHYLSLNQVRIVDSPILNAFVITQKADGIRRIHNHVFITTGLLKKMFAAENGLPSTTAQDLRKGAVRIAGVLSHELAHPIEEVDEEAFKKHLGSRVASQAREIRADAEGAIIARKAGYPPEAVYQGLARLFDGPRESQGMVEAAASTHPENNLRLSTQRVLLTLNRYQQGQAEPIYPGAIKPALMRDLASISEYQKSWTYRPPASIEDVANRLEGLKDLRQHATFRKVEFNRLVLSLDKMLLEKKAPLTEAEQESFRKAASHILNDEDFSILPRRQLRQYFQHDPASLELLRLPEHSELMNRIPAYSDPEHMKWLRTQRLAKANMGRGLSRMLSVAPAKQVIQEFKSELIEAIKQQASGFNPAYQFNSTFVEGTTREFEVRLTELYHSEVVPTLTPVERLRLELGSSIGPEYIYPKALSESVHNGATRAEGILTRRMEILGDRRKVEVQDLVRRQMQRIWDARGYYGVIELNTKYAAYDWEAIWSTLGIPPEQGKAQLRSAVKQFTKTPEYVSLLKEFSTGKGIEEFEHFFQGNPAIKFSKTLWLDETLHPYLAGTFNPEIQKDPALKSLATRSVAGQVLIDERVGSGTYDRVYRQRLKEALAAEGDRPRTGPEILAIHEKIQTELFSQDRGKSAAGLIHHLESIPATESERRIALTELLIGSQNEKMGWLEREDPVRKQTIAALKKYSAISDTTDLLRKYLKSPARKESEGFYKNYFRILSSVQEELLVDLDTRLKATPSEAGRRKEFLAFTEEFLDPAKGKYILDDLDSNAIQGNSRKMRLFKAKVVEIAEKLKLSAEENERLFQKLTATGPTQASDQFFRKYVGTHLSDPLNDERYKALKAYAEGKRFNSSSLQVDVAKKLLDGEIESMSRARNLTPEKIETVVKRINAYAPAGSLKKDQYLEDISWRLNIAGKALIGLIEDEKSINWKKANPLLVNLGSSVGGPLSEMNYESRMRIIEYLLHPEKQEFPAILLKDVEETLYREQLLTAGIKPELARANAQEGAYLFKYKLEAAMMDATPSERIPLFELVLSSGKNGLMNSPEFPLNISRKFLGYAADSVEEKLLISFLNVVPQHERSVTISYLLSQMGQDKSSIKSLFEVFQTVGIKFGQMTSIWNVFGDKISRETAALKDSAAPMTKAEIESVLDTTLKPEERAKIKRLKSVIGSASLKTVALAELADGKEAVILVQRPHANEQIRSNLNLSEKFIQELRRAKVDVPTGMFDAIVTDLRGQLVDETKMSDEAKKLAQAREHYQRLNQEMAPRMKGYRFEVPAAVGGFEIRDHLLVIEKAQGVTWAKASPELRSAVGEQIAEGGLRTFFREGWFDPDRHGGNVIIDEKNKTIRPIDFGQVEEYTVSARWTSDDRYKFAKFLKAVSEEDLDGLVEFGAQMAEKPPTLEERVALKARLKTAMTEDKAKPLSERIISIVNAFAEGKVKLQRKYSFGGLKGLMILQGEKYVSDQRFAELMRQEITHLLKEKLPLAVVEGLKGVAARCARGFRNLLTIGK